MTRRPNLNRRLAGGLSCAAIAAAAGVCTAEPPPVHAWTSFYAGPAGFYNNAKAITTDPAGNIYVIGESATGTGSAMATVKYSPFGAELWSKRYLGKPTGSDRPFSVLVGPDGNIIVAGMSDGTLGPNGNSFADYLIVKYNAADGTQMWEQRYDGPGNNFDALISATLDPDGNVLATGQSWSGVDYDWVTIKVDYLTGALLWNVSQDGVSGGPDGVNDAALGIASDSAGNAYVTGWVQVGYDFDNEVNLYAYGTARYSPAGDRDWFTVIGDEANTGQAVAIAIDGNGNPVITGSKYPDGTYELDAGTGDPVWSNDYQGPGGVVAFPYALQIAPDGDVVIAGSVCIGTSFCDESHAAWKISRVDGALEWDSTYTAHPANRAGGSAHGLAIDADGNVYTTGYYIFFSGPQRAVTRRIDADGAERWVDSFLGTAPGGATPDAANFAATIDPLAGGVVTLGTEGKSSESYLTTIKYRPCSADFDGTGFVDTDDFDAFVHAFEAGGDDADFDQSGFVDTDDFDAFVHAFELGC